MAGGKYTRWRKVLKTTGMGLASICGFSSTVSAADGQVNQNGSGQTEFETVLVEETDEYKLTKVTEANRSTNTIQKKFLFKLG